MAEILSLEKVILAVIIGTLLAIVYALRVLILLERRVASMEMNIQRITGKILKEEGNIERTLSQAGLKAASSKKRR